MWHTRLPGPWLQVWYTSKGQPRLGHLCPACFSFLRHLLASYTLAASIPGMEPADSLVWNQRECNELRVH